MLQAVLVKVKNHQKQDSREWKKYDIEDKVIKKAKAEMLQFEFYEIIMLSIYILNFYKT